MSVTKELTQLMRLKVAAGEPVNAFVVRLAKKANNLADEDWETLDGATQDWVNDALRAIQSKKPVEHPPGIEELFPNAAQEPPPAPKPKRKKGEPTPPEEVKMRTSERMAPADKIEIIVEGNPHREGTKDRTQFDVIKSGMTVEEAVAAGAARSYVRYILNKGYISVG